MRSSRTLIGAWLLSTATATSASTIDVAVVSTLEESRLATAVLWARSPTAREPVALGKPRSGRFVVPHEGLWTVSASGTGIWSIPVDVIAPGRAEVRIEPGVELRAVLRAPKQVAKPEVATLRLSKCSSPTSLPETSCPVEPDGTLTCGIPLGCLDLRLKVRGFASNYFWAKTTHETDATLDLGTLELKPGASVAGWITTEDGRPLDPSLEVRLQPQGVKTGTEALTTRLKSTAMSAIPNRGGFFQIADMATGDYELTASQKGYGTATVPLIHVREGLETALPNPVVLASPRVASFQVTPSTSPKGEPWSLRLAHHQPAGVSVVEEKPLDESGYGSFGGLVPGKYGVTLLSGPSGSPLAFRQIEVAATSELYSIDLDLVEVEGSVVLGGEPLAEALLVFGGRTGATSVELAADREGRFRGALPREGRWAVDISCEDLNLHRNLTNVEVRRRRGKRTASVEIRLTDGRVSGTVVDEAYAPQPRALVEVRPSGTEEAPVAIKAEQDGTFELRGLPKGAATIRAAAQDAESEPEAIMLSETGVDRLQIVVKKKRLLRGRVLDRSGAVAAANTSIREYGGVMQRGDGAITEFDGSFEVSIPSDVAAVHARVGAAGRTLWVGRRDVNDSGLTIELAREGGTVELLYPPDSWEWVYFVHDGGSSWYGPFQAWAALHENLGGLRDFALGRLVIPQLAPGDWDACLVEPGSAEWLSVAIFGKRVPTRCAHFAAYPGAVAIADLRDLEATR